eukprot:TRINITY_DN26417_c0_g2_i1.p6 TRINITY_DN26417_c0_g2~~TRINITY_DN26417_c0_g2_i1.p6  ORF type:complete len:102 (+),score=14.95 TRINITY_DN26417_c0_g2_i1:62-367(+)
MYSGSATTRDALFPFFFFFKDTATTEIYTLHIVGSVRCVQETVSTQSTWDSNKHTHERNQCFTATHISLQKSVHLFTAAYIITYLLNNPFLRSGQFERKIL